MRTEDLAAAVHPSLDARARDPISSGDDPRVMAAVQEYLALMEAGVPPSRGEFVTRYPEIAGVLGECLEGLAFVQAVAPALSDPLGGQGQAPLGTAEAPLVGTLGDFRLIREVGRGGMGIVYEAEQVSLGRRVALKVLPFAATMDARHLQRFHNESRAAASLHHEHIVPVHAVGQERGVHYYAMQFIDGQTLAEGIAQQRGVAPATADTPTVAEAAGVAANTPPVAAKATDSSRRGAAVYRRAAELVAKAAEALEYAHGLGVVHRDVKPANLMLDAQGKLWVTDFGLARVGSDSGVTLTGDVLGTLRYMSPEQALAKHGLVDHRTDVYALGATLYELLTLRPVVDGKDREEILRKITFDEPTPLRSLDRDIPVDLETVVLKALAKEPAERYATAKELAEDLRRFLADEPIRARRPGPAQRLRKWALRHRRAVTFAVGVLAVAVVALAASALYAATAYRAEKEERNKAEEAGEKAREAEGKEAGQRRAAETERDAAEYRRYVADMRLALQEWEEGEFDAVTRRLEAHRPKVARADPRGWEWYYLQSLCHSELATFQDEEGVRHNTGGENRQIAWSPGGQFLAWTLTDDGSVWLWDTTAKGDPRILRGHDHEVRSLSWSPNGQQLASVGRDGIRVWDPRTGQTAFTLTMTGDELFAATFTERVIWHPDGQRLAFVDGISLKVWDIRTNKECLRVRLKQSGPAISWSPDGVHIAVTDPPSLPDNNPINHTVGYLVYDASSGREVLRIPPMPGSRARWAAAWSPDGKQLLLPAKDGGCRVVDLATGGEVHLFKGEDQCQFGNASWSPDGKRLAAIGLRVKVWDATTGKELVRIERGGSELAWSADGQRLAVSTAKAIEVWDVPRAKQLLTLRGPNAHGPQLAWEPSGRRLASADSVRATVKIWDTTRPQGHTVLGLDTRQTRQLMVWRPDGQRLVTVSWEGIRVWDPSAARNPIDFNPPGQFVASVAWSPDGKRLATTSQPDPAVRIWDPESGKELLALAPPARPASPMLTCFSVAWSPDGNHVAATYSDGTVRVWDPTTREVVADLSPVLEEVRGGDGVRSKAVLHGLAWSPDGRLLATSSMDVTLLWDTATWQPLTPFGGGGTRLTWGPDGLLAASTSDHSGRPGIVVRKVASGKEVLSLEGIEFTWSPDGRRIAATSPTGLIKVWDVVTGDELLRLSAPAYAIAWCPDGRRLAAWGVDGSIRIWDSSPGHAVPPPSATPRDDPEGRARFVQEQNSLALALRLMGRSVEAEANLREVVSAQERLVAEFPRRAQYRHSLVKLHRELGEWMEEAGQGVQGEAAFRRAADLLEGLTVEEEGVKTSFPENTAAWQLQSERVRIARLLTKAGRHREAAAEYSRLVQVLSIQRLSLPALNNVAWALATCLDPEGRDLPTAVAAAQRAWDRIKIDGRILPSFKGMIANTLGVVHYRNGDSKAAIEFLNKSVELRDGGDSSDFFFLAMAHWRLGEKDKAKEWYDKASAWMDKNKPQDEELKRFRAEAAELLGIKEPPSPKESPAPKP